MSAFETELKVALAAVQVASRVCQSVQKQITREKLDKKDNSPVTIADFASQAIVCRALAAAFPDDPVVGEEDSAELLLPENRNFLDQIKAELDKVGIAGSTTDVCGWIDRGAGQSGSRFWTLDPIDGTKGFLRGEQYAISLALIIDGRISLGILGCPNLSLQPGIETSPGTMMFAIRGQGSWSLPINSESLDRQDAKRITVSRSATWPEIRFCESVESGHSSHSRSAQIAESLGIVKTPARLDSQAKYAVVARGEADVYLRLPTKADYREKIWDHAGGVIVVEEAGGRVTDITGQPLEFTHGRELAVNRGVVATNGPLHDELLKALRDAEVA